MTEDDLAQGWQVAEGVVERAWGESMLLDDGSLLSGHVPIRLLRDNEALLTTALKLSPTTTPPHKLLHGAVLRLMELMRMQHALEPHDGGKNLHRLRFGSGTSVCSKCTSKLATLDMQGMMERSSEEAWFIRKLISRVRLLKRRRQRCRDEAVERLKSYVVIRSSDAGSVTTDSHSHSASSPMSEPDARSGARAGRSRFYLLLAAFAQLGPTHMRL